MSQLVTVATCSLNQWALDFEGNTERILQSIRVAKQKGARLRIGPELEITGYGCFDHYLEADTMMHSWQMFAKILFAKECQDIIVDVGMPISHKNRTYNCRCIFLNGKVLLVRPKMWMANDGNYNELRYFTPWTRPRHLEELKLPRIISDISGQRIVPFGDGILHTNDTTIGVEVCEELFTPASPHVPMGLEGVEIFTNSSGSHHELRKLNRRMDLIRSVTLGGGGVYLYANQQGCDGDRLYYDGCAMIFANGKLLAQGGQFSLEDVSVETATVDLSEIRAARNGSSRCQQASQSEAYPRIDIDFDLTGEKDWLRRPSSGIVFKCIPPPEEISLGPACWLWDYLRRARCQGYFLPLSGGIDSCSTAVIVHSMCRLVVKACATGDQQVIDDARRISGQENSNYIPSEPREFASRIFCTAYMGTSNSSSDTRVRATKLAEQIGSYHLDFSMDTVLLAIVTLFTLVTGKVMKYRAYGGVTEENFALKNIQARLRMILAYLFASLVPWCRGRKGCFLVLGSANVDESLRGYMTKYDCSSADLNPIGGISKSDLRGFIAWARVEFSMPLLDEFLHAEPTAELEPIVDGFEQSDEIIMGFTYDELSALGRIRKKHKCGPFSTFTQLLHEWKDKTPLEIAAKVKKFYFEYAKNRHKMTVLTPSYHAESYSPDDNRFDMRPFLYPATFPLQFKQIGQQASLLLEALSIETDFLLKDELAATLTSRLQAEQKKLQ